MNLSDRVVSWIRTAVPVGVGVLVTWLATKLGIVLDAETSAALGAFAAGVAAQLYYTGARWLEARWPAAGWLLGVARAPEYPKAQS